MQYMQATETCKLFYISINPPTPNKAMHTINTYGDKNIYTAMETIQIWLQKYIQ